MPLRGVAAEPRILLVEDDRGTSLLIRRELEAAGMRVAVAGDGRRGLVCACEGKHDLVVLDIELPGIDGFQVLRQLRGRQHGIPVVMLSGRTRRQDVVEALEEGADDYLTKPCCAAELVARIHAVLRREQRGASSAPLSFGDLSYDRATQTIQCGAAPLALTPRELLLLGELIACAPAVVPREALLRDVCGLSFNPGTNVIDVHVSRVRAKLQRAGSHVLLLTVRAAGFRLSAERDPAARVV